MVSTIAIVLVVLTALAIPVGIVVYDSGENELRGRMEEQLVAINSSLADDIEAGQEPNVDRLLNLLTPGDGLQIISPDGGLIVSQIPEDIVDPISVTRSRARRYPDRADRR